MFAAKIQKTSHTTKRYGMDEIVQKRDVADVAVLFFIFLKLMEGIDDLLALFAGDFDHTEVCLDRFCGKDRHFLPNDRTVFLFFSLFCLFFQLFTLPL